MKDNDISYVANFFKVVQASHGLSLKISLTFNSEQEWKIIFVLSSDGESSTRLGQTSSRKPNSRYGYRYNQ